MAQTVMKMYASGSAPVDAVASLDIPEDMTLEGALVSFTVEAADALDDAFAFELSFAATSGFASNDTRASILGARSAQEFLTSGGGPVGEHFYVPMDIDLQGGERIYVHATEVGTCSYKVSIWLYVRAKGGGGPRRRPNFR